MDHFYAWYTFDLLSELVSSCVLSGILRYVPYYQCFSLELIIYLSVIMTTHCWHYRWFLLLCGCVIVIVRMDFPESMRRICIFFIEQCLCKNVNWLLFSHTNGTLANRCHCSMFCTPNYWLGWNDPITFDILTQVTFEHILVVGFNSQWLQIITNNYGCWIFLYFWIHLDSVTFSLLCSGIWSWLICWWYLRSIHLTVKKQSR